MITIIGEYAVNVEHTEGREFEYWVRATEGAKTFLQSAHGWAYADTEAEAVQKIGELLGIKSCSCKCPGWDVNNVNICPTCQLPHKS